MARASQVRRAVITGAPGAGKSTLLEAVASCEIATQGEVARAILQGEGGMALRSQRPLDFALAMLDAQVAAWDAAGQYGGIVLSDRGFPDIAGFLRLEGLSIPPTLDRACRTYRYEGPVFHAPPWRQIYRRDEERIQSWDEAVASDAAVIRAWCDYGYDPVELPLASTAERADFVIARL